MNSTHLPNQQKAIEVLQSLASGDPHPITQYVNPELYIQHNLHFADGRQTMLQALPILQESGATVDIKRSFTDGDYVFLHTQYYFFGQHQVGIDIFRFQDGFIVEHWDNLEKLYPANRSGHTQIDGETKVTEEDKTQENKDFIKQFVHRVLIEKELNLLPQYINEQLIQHHSFIEDGLAHFITALTQMIQKDSILIEKNHFILGEGNFVLAVNEGKQNGVPISLYNLFRIENGKIQEYWSTLETILPEEERKHTNGKF